jgi:hypothetical protein
LHWNTPSQRPSPTDWQMTSGGSGIGEQNHMKTFLCLFVVCVGVNLNAAAQANFSSLSAEPAMLRMAEHQSHASQTGMALVQNVLERTTSISVHGEKPLWESIQESPEVPLGDVARSFRAERAAAKRSTVIWTK